MQLLLYVNFLSLASLKYLWRGIDKMTPFVADCSRRIFVTPVEYLLKKRGQSFRFFTLRAAVVTCIL